MKALSKKGQSDFPYGRAIAQCCELRDRCFASANSSNTATQGWSWQPPLPASHHAPHSTMGQGPHGSLYASLHIPVFSLICAEGSKKNPPASVVCSGRSLPWPHHVFSMGLLSLLKYLLLAGGLSLRTPCACLHRCIPSRGAAGLFF